MTARVPPSGWQRVLLILLRVFFGLVFAAAGVSKLIGADMMVKEFALFAPFGIGQWFRHLTGGLEIIGALLLLPGRWVTAGAALLACVSVGALIAQLTVIHQDPIHAAVFAVLLGWIAYAHRD